MGAQGLGMLCRSSGTISSDVYQCYQDSCYERGVRRAFVGSSSLGPYTGLASSGNIWRPILPNSGI